MAVQRLACDLVPESFLFGGTDGLEIEIPKRNQSTVEQIDPLKRLTAEPVNWE